MMKAKQVSRVLVAFVLSVAIGGPAAAQDGLCQTARACEDLGDSFFDHNTEAALNAYERAAQLAPDDPTIQTQLGQLYERVGRLDDAIAAYTRVLETAGATDQSWQAAALTNLGTVVQIRGDLAAAEEYYLRGMAIDEELGSKEGMAINLTNLGNVAQQQGDIALACERWARSQRLFAELGSPTAEQVSGWMREFGCPAGED